MAVADKEVLPGWLWRVPFLASVVLIVIPVLSENPGVPAIGKAQGRGQEPYGADLEALQEKRAGRQRAAHGREPRSSRRRRSAATSAFADGSLDVTPVITHEYGLSAGLEAFAMARNPAESGKVLLDFRRVGFGA